MKYTIEFELPNNITIEDELQGIYVSWAVWGHGGVAKAKPVEEQKKEKWEEDPWSAIRTMLNELEQKQERLYANYCDSTARLKAINKIAKSGQKPNQKVNGIKPLAEMEVTK